MRSPRGHAGAALLLGNAADRGGGEELGGPAATSPFHLTPSIPYHGPMPTHTRPTTPCIRPTIHRSCPGRGTSLPVRGESRGGKPPLSRAASRPGGCAPSYQNLRGGAGQGELERLCRRVGGPTQRRNAGPSLPLAAAAAPTTCLVSLCRFPPLSTEAVGPRSARALVDTTRFPLSTFSTPPSGAVRPPSGQCLADTVRFPLSTCPARLKPKLHRVPPGTEEPEKNACHNSVQIKPLRPTEVCEANEPGSGS